MPTRPVPVIVFEDAVRVPPLDDLRPSFLVRTGALCLLERLLLDSRVRVLGVVVSPERAELTRECVERAGLEIAVNSTPAQENAVFVNGRCPLMQDTALSLAAGAMLRDAPNEDDREKTPAVVAATMRADAFSLDAFGRDAFAGMASFAPSRSLISRPWHVRSFRDACLAHDHALLATRLPPAMLPVGATLVGPATVFAGQQATIYPATIFDTTLGAITLGEHATVRPGAILIGPCHVGPYASVLERATIRPNTAIGPHCKVNGEVGGTIFQGYSNKAHDGYLGDSWLGEWVNLGAGTTNSNLLNTYAETIAKATPDGRHERTGEQFLGAIIGDHVKTAICSRLMTASVLHLGSMFATTAPIAGTIAPFTWATDAGVKTYRVEKFVEVAQAAMARRKVTMSRAYLDALRSLATSANASR